MTEDTRVLRWAGEAVSSSRLDKLGRPKRYGLFIYEDGRATCACPAWQIKKNDKTLTDEQRERYRCKHLEKAFSDLGDPSAVARPVPDPPKATPNPKPPKPTADDDPFFDIDMTPIARRY